MALTTLNPTFDSCVADFFGTATILAYSKTHSSSFGDTKVKRYCSTLAVSHLKFDAVAICTAT